MNNYLGYHKAHELGPFGGEEFFTAKRFRKDLVGATLYVVSAHKVSVRGSVDYRCDGKFMVDLVEDNNTSWLPDKPIRLVLKPVAVPTTPVFLDQQPGFDKSWFRNQFASGQGLSVIPADAGSLIALLDDLLPDSEGLAHEELMRDLEEVKEDPDVRDETEREELRKARIGQGKFRKETIAMWGGESRCALTGLAIPELLTASHIIPWRNATNRQRLSGANGIMLCAHLDRLFDRHLMGFQPTGRPDLYKVILANPLKAQAANLKSIGISDSMILDLTMVKFQGKSELERHLGEHLSNVLAE